MTETAAVDKPRYRVKAGSSSLVTRAEGQPHPGPYFLPVTGGWLSAEAGASMNWWQNGHSVMGPSTQSAMVEACVSAYSQTVAMCPGDHWQLNDKGGRDRVTTSALSRLLRHPNDYQSISDFLLNTTRSLYLYGNAYALCLRNSRYEIDELHLMDPMQSYPRLATTGDVFYQLYGNDIIQRRLGAEDLIVPQRDVLHIRLHTVRHRYPTPLVGESPICAAYPDIGVNAAIAQQQLKYYMNEARPSAVLSTDLVLDKDQVQYLRDRWNEQAQGLHKGGTPILTAGLKVQPWSQGGRDAATADMMKLSNEHIALAFRIPLQILGLGGTNYASTELLMQSWKASGLGFALNHIEEAIGLTFGLGGQPQDYVEFDTEALLRSAMKDRIEALTRGVTGSIYSSNEARALEGLPAVKDGDEPRAQAQLVPLSAWSLTAPKTSMPASAQSSQAAPAAVDQQPPSQKGDRDAIEREVRKLITGADRINRRRNTAGFLAGGSCGDTGNRAQAMGAAARVDRGAGREHDPEAAGGGDRVAASGDELCERTACDAAEAD